MCGPADRLRRRHAGGHRGLRAGRGGSPRADVRRHGGGGGARRAAGDLRPPTSGRCRRSTERRRSAPGVGPPQTDDMRAFYGRVQTATRCAYQDALPAYNAMRAGLGLAPLADLFDQLGAAGRILIATSRAFDFDQDLPEPYRYVGPYFEDPPWTEDWTAPWAAERPAPAGAGLVLDHVPGPGAGAARGPSRRWERCRCAGVVTLGPVLSPQDFPAPDNVIVTAARPARADPAAGLGRRHPRRPRLGAAAADGRRAGGGDAVRARPARQRRAHRRARRGPAPQSRRFGRGDRRRGRPGHRRAQLPRGRQGARRPHRRRLRSAVGRARAWPNSPPRRDAP